MTSPNEQRQTPTIDTRNNPGLFVGSLSAPPTGHPVYTSSFRAKRHEKSYLEFPSSCPSGYGNNTGHGGSGLGSVVGSGGQTSSRVPPKTSRFYKSLPENRSEVNSSNHHYNPFLYLQHRTRVNPPLDLNVLATRRRVSENFQHPNLKETEVLIHKDYDFVEGKPVVPPHNEIHSIPVFYMAEDDFQDPVTFCEKIGHIGRKYGAIKVVPPSSWSTSFSLNTELFWFRSRRQILNNMRSEMDSRLEFYFDLYKFHQKHNKLGNVLNKLPSIDKRTLDLYLLRQYVHLRGGFHAVCKRKLWAQIGRELGYSGRIMTSLSSSLKSAYQRVILDFDEQFQKDASNSNYNGNDDDSDFESQPRKRRKKDKDHSPKRNINNAPLIMGSAPEYKRPRDILRSKGFHTYFNNTTEEKRSITCPDKFTLSSYRFYDWFNANLYDVLDSTSYDSRSAPLYNLKQFFEKNIKFEEKILKQYATEIGLSQADIEAIDSPFNPFNPTRIRGRNGAESPRSPMSPAPDSNFPSLEPDQIEKLFWHVARDPKAEHDIEIGMAIESRIHESGFPTIGCPQPLDGNKTEEARHPWNLNNFATNKHCLLRYLDDDDYGQLTRPKLDIGMLFSTTSWHTEDHFLYEASYSHLGSSKIWYTVPPQYQQQLEALIKNQVRIRREEFRREDESLDHHALEWPAAGTASLIDYFACCVENKVDQFCDTDRFKHRYHEVFDKFFPKTRSYLTSIDRRNCNCQKTRVKKVPVVYNTDSFLSPEYLLANGIPVYKGDQKPGQFIIKFARAYTATVSTGFSVTESVNFAPLYWIDHAFEAEKWLVKQNIIPAFSATKILLNIASDKEVYRNDTWRNKITRLYDKFYQMENSVRTKVKELIPSIAFREIDPSEVDYKDVLSDHTLEACYPSKVVITYKASRYQVSLFNFVSNCSNRDFTKFCTSPDVKVEVQLYCSDAQLEMIHGWACASDQGVQQWVTKFRAAMESNLKPELEELRKLAMTPLSLNHVDEFRKLQKFIEEADAWVRDASLILGESSDHTKLDYGAFKAVMQVVPQLQFTCREVRDIISLSKSIVAYNDKVTKAMESNNDLEEFKKLATEGEKYNIDLSSLEKVKKVVKLTEWEQYSSEASESPNKILDLNIIKNLYEEGLSLYDHGERSLLIQLRTRLNEGEALDKGINHILDSANSNMYEFQRLVARSEHVAIFPETKERIDKVMADQEVVKERLQASFEQIRELQFLALKEIAISTKLKSRYDQSQSFDPDSVVTEEEDDFLRQFSLNFNGGAKDQRQTYNQVHQLVEQAKHSALKNFYTDELERELERCDAWRDSVFRILPAKSPVLEEAIIDFIYTAKSELDIDVDQYSSDTIHRQDALISPTKPKCVCRYSIRVGRMIFCQSCGEWYHERCLKNNFDYKILLDEVFKCPVCDPMVQHFPRPSFNQILDLYFQARRLLICPNELYLVSELVEICRRFLGRMCEELKMSLFTDSSKPQVSTVGETDIGKLRFFLRKLEGSIEFSEANRVLRRAISFYEKNMANGWAVKSYREERNMDVNVKKEKSQELTGDETEEEDTEDEADIQEIGSSDRETIVTEVGGEEVEVREVRVEAEAGETEDEKKVKVKEEIEVGELGEAEEEAEVAEVTEAEAEGEKKEEEEEEVASTEENEANKGLASSSL